MGDVYHHPVFFEVPGLLGEQKEKRIETYFRIQRKSGGGDCGALERLSGQTYRVAFNDPKAQLAVLQRREHVVDGLVFSVRGSREAPSSSASQDSTAPLQTFRCVQEDAHQPDQAQQAVLQRREHVVDGLVFSVRGSREAPSSSASQDSTAPLQTFRCVQEDAHQPDQVSNRRIVILGKTGVGKSSLANNIFGEELVEIGHTVISDTSECQAITKTVNGRNITLIDTPGFFDTNRSEEELKPEIVRCIIECAPGPHAFLIVLKMERYTEQEQAVITKINQYFSEEVFKYATVLFTHGDQIPEGQTIEEFVCKSKPLSDLVKKCGDRCHVVDNKYWKNNQQEEYRSNQFQVEELLKTIDKMVEANEGRCYTNEMLQAVEEEIEEEVQLIKQSPGNMSEKQSREKAKDIVYNRLLIKVIGITAGALLGALLGGVVSVKVAVSALNVLGSALNLVAADGKAETDGAENVKKGGIIAGKSLLALTVTSAVGGAVAGGVAGYYAAEGADTPIEAVKKTAKVVIDGSKSTVDAAKYCLSKQ